MDGSKGTKRMEAKKQNGWKQRNKLTMRSVPVQIHGSGVPIQRICDQYSWGVLNIFLVFPRYLYSEMEMEIRSYLEKTDM